MTTTTIATIQLSKEDMARPFSETIKLVENQGLHRAGIIKFIPTEEWKSKMPGYKYNDINQEVPKYFNVRIKEVIHQSFERGTLNDEVFSIIAERKRGMLVENYRKLSLSDKYNMSINNANFSTIEKLYFQALSSCDKLDDYNENVIYGADVSKSFFPPTVLEWNLNNLDCILKNVAEQDQQYYEGIHSSYSYFGMWRTTFGWHTEDEDLYSINFQHWGKPKFWYSIPLDEGWKLEEKFKIEFNEDWKNCNAAIRHKYFLPSIETLEKWNITVNRIVQNPGEFIVTFPHGYHAGFNSGLNCNEAINFATDRWIEYGIHATHCRCRNAVEINMLPYIEKYRPGIVKEWKSSRQIGNLPQSFRPQIIKEVCIIQNQSKIDQSYN